MSKTTQKRMDRKDGKQDGKVGDIPLSELYYEPEGGQSENYEGGTKIKPFKGYQQGEESQEEEKKKRPRKKKDS